MAITNKIISFWKQVRAKSSDMFTLFKVGIGVKVPTHKLHVKDTTDPIKVEGLQNDTTDPDKFLTIDSSNIVKYRTGTQVLSDLGIAADEILDWTADQSSTDTIHTNNITDLHGAGVNGAANQILTDDGDGTVSSESKLTFDSTARILELGGDTFNTFTIKRKAHSDNVGGPMRITSGDSGGTDKAGGDLEFRSGKGTGNALGGAIEFYVSTAESSGDTAHSAQNVDMTITDGQVAVAGNITVTGTVDGRDVSTDGTKLDGIEASADVTDTANVTSAGALMDSEVTNLSQVKAFDSSDYATAAQGAKADSAQQPPSEGAFVNGDKTKLDGIAAGATADQTNVTGSSGSCTGNAATATALATPRAINGVDFDGTAPITVTAAGSTLSDTVTVSKGGTGATTLTSNAVLTGNGTSAITPEQTLSYDLETLSIGADDNGVATITRLTHSDDDGGRLVISGGNSTGTNKNGGNLVIEGGKGTGTGTGGNIEFYSHAAGSSGSTAGTLTEVATIDSSGNLSIDGDLLVDGDNITNSASATNFNISSSRILELQHAGSYDIQLGNSTNADVLKVSGSTEVVTVNGNLSVTGQVDATLGNKYTKTGNTDGTYQGDVVYFGGTTSMTIGKIYHYKSDGTWEIVNADAVSTCDGLLGVALGAASDTNGMLLRGMVTLDHDPGAVGDVLYVQSDYAGTPGEATATAPSESGDCVRVVGYCLDASNGQIWFNPDNTFVEVA